MDAPFNLSRMDLEIVQSIIDAVPDGVYVADKDGYFVAANEGFERIAGIDRNELVGKHSEYLVEKKYISKALNMLVLKDGISRTEMRTYPSGKEVLVSAILVLDKRKRVVGVVSCLRDLTELNSMQRRLQQSNLVIEKYKERIDLLEETINPAAMRFVAQSDKGKHVLSQSLRVANSDVTVLIRGESGVGKEIIARYIHEHSNRKEEGVFVKIDCAALPPSLLESEIFGYEKGSFTNARREGKKGLLETANKGTLFLDEIGELPFELQSKLLTAIQDREIKRIGGLVNLPIDVRIITATNRNLEQMIEERKFRHDLYYRLNVVQINIPPLRERREDIGPLINHFMDHFNKIYKSEKHIVSEGIKLLTDYDWPGNVRELKNVIERLVIMSPDDKLTVCDIKGGMNIGNEYDLSQHELIVSRERIGSMKTLVSQFERDIIEKALSVHGNLAETARDLEIDISTLTRKKKKLNIKINRSSVS
jgi:PAS domain S-box-containing protein